jgi:hypothetical protein
MTAGSTTTTTDPPDTTARTQHWLPTGAGGAFAGSQCVKGPIPVEAGTKQRARTFRCGPLTTTGWHYRVRYRRDLFDFSRIFSRYFDDYRTGLTRRWRRHKGGVAAPPW